MRTPGSIIIMFLLIFTGCNILQDKPTEGSNSVTLKELETLGYGADLYSCNKDCFTKLLTKTDTNFIINNVQDYSKLISKASCLDIPEWPEVDFIRNTLLAGVIISPTSCARLLREELIYDPFKVTYTLTVTLQTGSSQTSSAIFFWGLTDKIPADANIIFDYKYNSIQ